MRATTSPAKLLIVILIVSFLSVPSVRTFSDVVLVYNSTPASEEPLSIILMIGDGMGFEHVELARLVEVGEFGSLNMQDSDWNASVTTHSANAAVTDSAAAGTAIATGTKTNNYIVGMDASLNPLETILEFAQTLNKSTGVVSTSIIAHATPASFMTHVNDRDDDTEIVRQIVEEAGVDVLLGGGSGLFTGAQIASMASNGYSIVHNRTELATVISGKVLGLFAASHLSYEYDRDFAIQPSIAEMTNKSIELLSQDPDGFFLMVEGSQIDFAAHNGDKVRNALETIAFDKAVDVAMDYVKDHNNTILIVTADHETGGLVVLSHNLSSELPEGLLSEEDKRTLRAERANNVTADWTTTYHTNIQVPLFALGNAFSDMSEDLTIDNTDIYDLMKDFYLGNPLNETELTTTTTTTGSTTTTTTETETTTDTTSSTEPTNGPNIPLNSYLVLAVSIASAIVILAVIMLIRRR